MLLCRRRAPRGWHRECKRDFSCAPQMRVNANRRRADRPLVGRGLIPRTGGCLGSRVYPRRQYAPTPPCLDILRELATGQVQRALESPPVSWLPTSDLLVPSVSRQRHFGARQSRRARAVSLPSAVVPPPGDFRGVARLCPRRPQGRNGSGRIIGLPFPAGKTYHSGLHSPNLRMYHAACAPAFVPLILLNCGGDGSQNSRPPALEDERGRQISSWRKGCHSAQTSA